MYSPLPDCEVRKSGKQIKNYKVRVRERLGSDEFKASAVNMKEDGSLEFLSEDGRTIRAYANMMWTSFEEVE